MNGSHPTPIEEEQPGMANDEYRCIRCGRIVAGNDSDFLAWEVIASEAEAWACPDCLTHEERGAVEDLERELMALDHCQRCGRTKEKATAEGLDDWLILDVGEEEEVAVCPGCTTHSERMQDIADTTEGLTASKYAIRRRRQ